MTAHVSAHYTPAAAGWVALVSGRRAALLEGTTVDGRVDAVLEALDSEDAVGALLGLLMRDGLASMPGFAFAEGDDSGSRILVRGAASAVLAGTEYRGADYSTWGEHRADGDVTVSLRAGSPATELVQSGVLPLSRGAAFAVALDLAAAVPPSDAPSPQDAVPERSADTETPAQEVAAESAAPALLTPPASATTSAPTPAPTSAPLPIAAPPAAPAPAAAAPVIESHAASSVPEQTMVEFTVADADPGYSHLFEETIVRPIEHAAIRDDEPEALADDPIAAPTPLPVDSGFQEHDGLTIVSGELAKLRADAPRQQTDPLPIASDSRPPAIAELRFSSGIVEKLTGPVIVGRSPSSGKVSAGRLPRLVTITDDPDLSRSHVQIEMQGDAVVVTDLHSRNGTTVVLPGRSPERLRGGVPTTVMDRTLIDLGGGLTIEVREPQGAHA